MDWSALFGSLGGFGDALGNLFSSWGNTGGTSGYGSYGSMELPQYTQPPSYTTPPSSFSFQTPTGGSSFWEGLGEGTQNRPQAPAESYISGFMERAGGNPYDALVQAERYRTYNPMQTDLRNAAHYLQTKSFLESTKGLGAPLTMGGVPAYTALKALSQRWPAVGTQIDRFIPRNLSLMRASQPSWEEIYYGYRPLGEMGAYPASP